ncbi:MAG TPA: hypothetical protein VHC97_20155 [Thermoanaerobaculia bacterium]|jgi:hypothetical protein|nr:hypothetical protein [Thermoanaerobaculia bacterium]
MKKSRVCQEVTPLNAAAFRVGTEAFRKGGLEMLLEETLAQVFGGLESGSMDSACTEFTCNVYAPPPPPTFG